MCASLAVLSAAPSPARSADFLFTEVVECQSAWVQLIFVIALLCGLIDSRHPYSAAMKSCLNSCC